MVNQSRVGGRRYPQVTGAATAPLARASTSIGVVPAPTQTYAYRRFAQTKLARAIMAPIALMSNGSGGGSTTGAFYIFGEAVVR